MHRTSRRLAVVLIASLLWMTTVDAVAGPQSTAQSDYVIRRQVELLGPGSELKLKLADGRTLEGSIGAVDSASFELISKKDHDRVQIDYRVVAEFEVRKVVFPEAKDMNVQVQRVVNQLGIGRHIQVKTSSEKVNGNVHRIWDDHFELLLDKKWKSLDVAYTDVRELSPQPSKRRQTGDGPDVGKVILMGFALFLIVVLPVQCSLRKDCHI